MKKQKRVLSKEEEFKIMHAVFDKFLLLSVLVMIVGLVKIAFSNDVLTGFLIIVGGAILLLIFALLLIKEYEIIKRYV
jgi:hypothetical protein